MIRLTRSFNTVTVKPGDIFEIALDSKPGPGGRSYVWDLQVQGGKMTQIGHKVEKPKGGAGDLPLRVVGLVKSVFTFVAAGEGDIEITALYGQNLEKGGEAIDACVFTIKVKP